MVIGMLQQNWWWY